MSNTTTEKKNILEEINSSIYEAEEQITELEGIMVEITIAAQNKGKRMKRNEDSLRDLWDNTKCINILAVPKRKRKRKRKGLRKYLKILWTNTSLTWERKFTNPRPGSTENPINDEPKEEHLKMCII